jgi:sn-glycerol 3-phosphate transport system substrate-binding protein
MRRSRRTVMSLVAAAALALTGFAFGPGVTAAASQGKTVIHVWLANFPFPGYLDSRIADAAAFNAAHPQYDVEVSAVDFNVLPQEVNAAVQAGDAPEIADYYYNATQNARDAKDKYGKPLFTSVQKAIGNRTSILGEPVVLNDIIAPAKSYYTNHGDLTSMPATVNTTMMYANQTLLAKAGITTLPTTWAQLEHDCTVLRALPDGPTNCITWPDHSWFFQQAVTEQGGFLSSGQNGRLSRSQQVNADSSQVMSYVNFWNQLAKNGDYLYTGTPNDFEFTFNAFFGQQVAFFLSTADQAGGLVQQGAASGFDVTSGRLPVNGQNVNPGNIISGDSLWLKAGLNKATQDGALAFMNYLDNTTNTINWYQSTGYLPMTNAAIAKLRADGGFQQNPSLPVALDQVFQANSSNSANGAVFGDFDGIQNTLTDAMNDVLLNGADPVARFHQADTQANQLLDQYNANCQRAGLLPAYCTSVGAFG